MAKGTKKPMIDMDSLFSGATQVHQLSQAEEQIQQLQKEIEELREQDVVPEAQLERLRNQLQSQSGIKKVELSKMRPNPAQPRQTFLPDSIQAIASSLKREGQLQPVILIELKPESEYLLLDGERRWRGANLIEWETLEAVIIQKPEQADSLHRQALLTSLHREDLNPLDKAEAIIKEIGQITKIGGEQIPRLLSTACRRLTKQGKLTQLSQAITGSDQLQQEILTNLELSETEQAIVAELLILQLNPASVDANIFPMLNLADDLKSAIRKQGLKGFQAIALGQLSAKNLNKSEKKALEIRSLAITKVIEEQLSVIQTRKLVKEIKEAHRSNSTPKVNNGSVTIVAKGMKKLSPEFLAEIKTSQLETLQQLMKQKLEEIGQILEQRQDNT